MNFEVSLRKVENYQRMLKATIIIVKNMQRCERILKSALETIGKERDAWPLKSTGNPGRGLFSFAADIALVTTFLNFIGAEKMLWKKGCLDEMWEELVSLFQDASLDSVLKLAALDMNTLREEEMQGLIIAMFVAGVAAVAIL